MIKFPGKIIIVNPAGQAVKVLKKNGVAPEQLCSYKTIRYFSL